MASPAGFRRARKEARPQKTPGTSPFLPRHNFSTSPIFARPARVVAIRDPRVVRGPRPTESSLERIAIRFGFSFRRLSMKRFSSVFPMFVVLLVVGFIAADSASAAGRRRSRNCCECPSSCAEPACAAAEPACGAAEPACCAQPSCCNEKPRRFGRARRSRNCCTSCCQEPACSADPACNAG